MILEAKNVRAIVRRARRLAKGHREVCDIRGAVPGHAMVIVAATTGELRAWRIRKGRAYRLRHRYR